MNFLMNSLFMTLLVMLIHYLLYDWMKNYSEQKSFECGFDMNYWIHPKLSLHFFKIGIIFVLFDLELMILILSFLKYIILIWLILIFIFFSLFIEFKTLTICWTM